MIHLSLYLVLWYLETWCAPTVLFMFYVSGTMYVSYPQYEPGTYQVTNTLTESTFLRDLLRKYFSTLFQKSKTIVIFFTKCLSNFILVRTLYFPVAFSTSLYIQALNSFLFMDVVLHNTGSIGPAINYVLAFHFSTPTFKNQQCKKKPFYN